jgi:hypothetical protein
MVTRDDVFKIQWTLYVDSIMPGKWWMIFALTSTVRYFFFRRSELGERGAVTGDRLAEGMNAGILSFGKVET